MADGGRILVINGLDETEEVLKAVLEPRGLEVHRVRSDRPDLASPESGRPHVLVVHEDETLPDAVESDAWDRIPRVIIGSARIAARPESDDGRQYLAQPFQYRELVQAVESLLRRCA